MAAFPTNVEVSEKGLKTLTDTFKGAYKQIVSEIADATDFGVQNRKQILSQIDKILTDLGVDVNDFVATELPEYYKTGANQAVQQMQKLGMDVPVSTGFNKVHQEAILNLVDETQRAYAESIGAVRRSADQLLGAEMRKAVQQNIATGMIQGSAVKAAAKTIKETLVDQGLSALVDKGGKHWSLDSYAEMLYRTKTVETRNMGLANRMLENGYDLVQVSDHNSSHQACADWEGQILSVTGATPGYPTLDEAESAGLFHPNCEHAINAINLELAAETKAYNPDTGEYDESTHDKVSAIIAQAEDYKSKFSDTLSSIAEENGLDFKVGNTKSEERALEKVINDYGLQAEKLMDTNRGAIFLDDPKDADALISSIKEKFDVTRVKDNMDSDTYQKIIVNISTPAGNAEIQLTTPEMWKATKELGGHALYEQVRIKDGDWQSALEEMTKIYSDAAKATAERLAK